MLSIVLALHTAAAMAAGIPEAPPSSTTVSGRTGPLQLSLTVPRRDYARGEWIRFRLSLTNVGRKRVTVQDNIFKDPRFLGKNLQLRLHTYLEIEVLDGAKLHVLKNWGSPFCHPKVTTTVMTAAEARAADAREAEARKADPLGEFMKEVNADPFNSMRNLEPGETISTPAWDAPLRADCEELPRRPVDSFTQLWNLPLKAAGRVRLRAVYDSEQSESSKARGFQPTPGQVKVTTPWIEVIIQ